MNTLTFIKQFLGKPAYVGAIAPSSKGLAEMVCRQAGVHDASVVIEFGAGTGGITGTIVESLQPDATFFSMELLEEFVDIVRDQLPQVDVIHDSAANSRKYLEERGHDHCDCIVSGLPWTTFSDELQDTLLDATLDVLRPGGCFATYMYLQSNLLPSGPRFLNKLYERFSSTGNSPVVWKNLPPARVFYAYK
jgi:phospholipid N-methyltransferase